MKARREMEVADLESAIDPRIMYAMIMPSGGQPRASLFQDFSEGMLSMRWAFERIVHLPATIHEPHAPLPALLTMRVTGLASWRLRQMPANLLRLMTIGERMPLWVLFTADDDAAAAATAFARRQRFEPLHFSITGRDGTVPFDEMSMARLRAHILSVIDKSPTPGLVAARPIIAGWSPREKRLGKHPLKGHFALLPNQMVLAAHGVEPPEIVPDWKSDKTWDYVEAILESADEVRTLRDLVEPDISFHFLPPRPDIWLVAPGFASNIMQRLKASRFSPEDAWAAQTFIRRVERQKLFGSPITEQESKRLDASPVAAEFQRMRNAETGVFAAAIGVRTAGSLAMTLRMPPAVNLVAGKVGVLAENLRSGAKTPPAKIAKLFREVQSHLRQALGSELIDRIEGVNFGVKIVSDVPVEWLPVGDLPLGLYCDVSRISATPGDLTVLQLGEHEAIRLSVEDFAEILVISAFKNGDAIGDMLKTALDIMGDQWRDRLTIRFVTAKTEADFAAALNTYDGPLMIFDGHGTHAHADRGKLLIGEKELDIWAMRGQVRVPPIVVLSACDTHAAGRSPLTTSNAFLALGARTVLATMLPIGGRDGAIFIGRLLLRLAQYIPVAIKTRGRVVRWSEVIGGMLRLQLFTDVMRPKGERDIITEEQYLELAPRAGYLASLGGGSWIPWLAGELAERGIMDEAELRTRIARALPLSDTIRYAQMGNPETILIGSLVDLPAEVRAQFEGNESGLEPRWKDPPELDPLSIVRVGASFSLGTAKLPTADNIPHFLLANPDKR